MDYSNITGGLRIPSQIPLDVKQFSKDEDTLAYLGIDDNLAFTYYDKLKVFCKTEKTTYEWREVQSGEENTGLVPLDFTYPANTITADVDYSNKTYNFFKVETVEFIVENSITSIGEGEEIYNGFNETTKKHEIKTIDSSTLSVNTIDGTLFIEQPFSDIPALYVNNLYIPTEEEFLAGNTKGFGTLAKPFTDTVTAYVSGVPTITPNTAIQNALDAYVGTGIYTRLNPEKSGQQIIVQNNTTGYTFPNNLSYTNLDFRVQGSVLGTTTDMVIDMDNSSYFNPTTSGAKITVEDGGYLTFNNSLGFNNSGNTNNADTYLTGRTLTLNTLGSGEIRFPYNGADVLTRYILNGEGNNNNGNLHFVVKAKLVADYQGVYFSKNKNRIDFYKEARSGFFNGSCNINLKAFHSTGGQIRFYEEGSLSISSNVSSRTYGITFEPTANGIGYNSFEINSSIINYNCNYLFVKLNNEDVVLKVRNTLGAGSTTFPLGSNTVVNGLFENLGVDKWQIEFKNNNFIFTGIDFDKVDLTQNNTSSVVNTIGNNIIENLAVFNSKAQAKLFNYPDNSVFLKRNVINAVDLVADVEYKIVTSGSPSLGTVGDFITATGSETSVGGTASLEIREIL